MPVSPAPEPPRPWLRLVLAISLDGRLAPAGGGAAQIGGRGDRRALEEALAWADAALIGAGTLRAHGCTALIHQPDLLAARQACGRPPQPLALAVARPDSLEAGLPFFQQPLRRWLLQAGPGAQGCGWLPPPAGYEAHGCFGRWPAALAALAGAGLKRLAVLGGAQLAAALLAEDLFDELQLSLCPQLLGGGHLWLPAAAALPGRTGAGAGASWSLLEQRDLGGGEILLRYRRPPEAPC
ncbi:MAG: dihydrofolate reductase family protein [Synechococcaceae cyanobacterium]|nr:dihydrofolate reductase family protein [Synechococcaceae cyanobacterium]